MESRTRPIVWTTWQWRGLIALMLVIASFTTASSLSHIARAAGILRDWPVEIHLVLENPAGAQPGWREVVDVLPGGAAARAGLQEGDLIRAQYGVWPDMVLAPGVRLPLTVERDGRRLSAQYIVPRQPHQTGMGKLIAGLQGVAGLVSTGLGVLLLLLRGCRNRSAALLGIVLQCLGWSSGGYGMLWAPATVVFALREILSTLAFAGICYFLPLAGHEVSSDQRRPKDVRRVNVLAGLLALAALTVRVRGAIWDVPIDGPTLLPAFLAALLTFGLIARNYRGADATCRNRIKIVALAFGGYVVSFALFFWFILAGQPPSLLWVIVSSALFGLTGPVLLAYAVLRQKLFDFNFVLNRTLVYGTISLVLLAAFGVAKWAIEHLIPESWHEGSEYYSFGIALALFLSLHRVHTWVERNVERVFFAPWHRNEEALRRFVAAAGHFDRTEVLCRAFVEEASRFAKGASAALYLLRADGAYAQACGSLGSAEPAGDDLVLALMRAERRPVKTVETRTSLPGVLALPMLDHGRLSGFLLLDRKGDGADYRPDEIEVLGWAAHQVGLDLQAMHASELEAEVATLREQLARRGARKRRAAPVALTAVVGASAT